MGLQRTPPPPGTDPVLAQLLTLIQDAVEKALIPLQNGPLNGGTLLQNISLSAGKDNIVAHPLKRVPSLILVTTPNVQSTIWNPFTASAPAFRSSATSINLWCSADCIVNVWVG